MGRRGPRFGAVVVAGLCAIVALSAPVPLASAANRSAVVDAAVERTSTGGLTISWKASQGARVTRVLWSNDPDHVTDVLVASVPADAHEVTVDDPSPGKRPYVALVGTDGSRTIVAERRIALVGEPNFRDLGGYRTKDGRTVRWGQLYRSGDLADLTDADLATVEGLGIKLVCDLRAPSEIQLDPDRAPGGAQTISIPVTDESQDPVKVREQVLAGDVSSLGAPGELLTEAGKAFPTKYAREYSKVMARLMDARYRPALVHCSAGKDRAGLAAALVLLTLGVPEKTVMKDYLLSNTYRAAENERAFTGVQALLDPEGVEVIRSLVEVRPQYLQASLDTIKKQYGSIDAYLRKGLGISDAARARFQRQLLTT
ncbi:MAG TPA: tyrosine-protein phosphatase [Acidimicrobiia bacterium]